MSADPNQNLFQTLATQPSSVTMTQNATITGRVTLSEYPGGKTLSRLVNIEFTAGQVVTDVNLISALVCLGAVSPTGSIV